MQACASLALDDSSYSAAAKATEQALHGLGGVSPSLAVMFATPRHSGTAEDLVTALHAVAGPVPLIGCIAESVIAGCREIEEGPAVSVFLASDMGEVETFAVDHLATAGGGLFAGHRFETGGGPYMLLCDPVSFPVGELLDDLNRHTPGAVVVGGMASGGGPSRQAQLFFDDHVLTTGAVGARLGGTGVDLLVSQGCRPIGSPYTVTRADGCVLHEVGGRPPYQRLQELVGSLSEGDRQLLADGGLQVGQVIDEYRHEQRRGDFLVRNVVGADPATGAIVVGGEIALGQTMQFHVRDAFSADEDLWESLERESTELAGRQVAAALLFTCSARGSQLFSAPDHDAALVTKLLGDIPIAGCSCAGELGPVGGKNFFHTLTASLAVFRDK
jgi:small ligand-binding sensory domain FIST